jgi:Holliday junction DNA helicase RuvA
MVLSVEPQGAVVEVAGFGIFVNLRSDTVLSVGKEVALSTYLAVTQNGMDLYGFIEPLDRKFFELLLTVSGVGPKTALSIFSRASRESLENAISKRDISYLTSVVGLGKKAAEKLAVELSEKIELSGNNEQGHDAEVFDTLIALGYTEREARKSLAGIPLSVEGREARLKYALSNKN